MEQLREPALLEANRLWGIHMYFGIENFTETKCHSSLLSESQSPTKV